MLMLGLRIFNVEYTIIPRLHVILSGCFISDFISSTCWDWFKYPNKKLITSSVWGHHIPSNLGRFRASKLSVGLTFHGQTFVDNVPGNNQLCPADSAGFSPALPKTRLRRVLQGKVQHTLYWRVSTCYTTSPELSVIFLKGKKKKKASIGELP